MLLTALGGVPVVMAAPNSRAAALLPKLPPSLQGIPRVPVPMVQTGQGLQLLARLIPAPRSIPQVFQAALDAPLNPIWTCSPRSSDQWRTLATQVDLLLANRAAESQGPPSGPKPRPQLESFSLDGVPASVAVPHDVTGRELRQSDYTSIRGPLYVNPSNLKHLQRLIKDGERCYSKGGIRPVS